MILHGFEIIRLRRQFKTKRTEPGFRPFWLRKWPLFEKSGAKTFLCGA
jgi:hypothetical protein